MLWIKIVFDYGYDIETNCGMGFFSLSVFFICLYLENTFDSVMDLKE